MTVMLATIGSGTTAIYCVVYVSLVGVQVVRRVGSQRLLDVVSGRWIICIRDVVIWFRQTKVAETCRFCLV